MIRCTVKGNFKKTRSFLKRALKLDFESLLVKYAEEGVEALKSATPVDTGKTADSWTYEIVKSHDKITISWSNSNVDNGIPIAIILDYGHATNAGGYVQGRHFIAPAIRPIFDKIAENMWEEVSIK